MITSKKSVKAQKEIKEQKSIQKSNERKIKNCVLQIENGCTKTVADKLEERIEELETENARIDKKLKRLQDECTSIPTFDEVLGLKEMFVKYMQSKNNLPLRKEFLQQVVEKITINDDIVEVIFNI